MLILSSCKEQILNGSNIDNEEFSLLTSNESNNKITLESIGEIVVLIKYFICKSNSLFEKVFAFFIDILINEINVSMNNGDIINQRLVSIISGHVVELLKCFDLTRASFIIKHFLEDSSTNSIDDKSLKQLLSNLIMLIYWPHDNNIDEWICSLMSIMAVKTQKFPLLVTVCEENVDFVSCNSEYCSS